MNANTYYPLLAGIAKDAAVYADKGYNSQANRQGFAERGLKDGIMQTAHRGCPLREERVSNGRLAKVRYAVEQSFGSLRRKFGYDRARTLVYRRWPEESHLKAMCVNLLKAATGSVCLWLPKQAGSA